jgi:hypothetical protein
MRSKRPLLGGIVALVAVTFALLVGVAAALGRPPFGPPAALLGAMSLETLAITLVTWLALAALFYGVVVVVLRRAGPEVPRRTR